MRKTLLISILLPMMALAQARKEGPPVTIRGNIGIPKPVSSKMFRTSFAGLYEANVSVNFKLFSNFYAGLGYQNSHFKNNEFLKYTYFNASLPYNTRLLMHAGFIKLGFDRFVSEKTYISYALNTGVIQANYFNVNEDTSAANKPLAGKKFSGQYVQPEATINFIVDPKLSFSLVLSYTTLFYHFDPKAPRFNQFSDINKLSNRHYMSWINFGFGFNILFNGK
jgi:hypothetical protein